MRFARWLLATAPRKRMGSGDYRGLQNRCESGIPRLGSVRLRHASAIYFRNFWGRFPDQHGAALNEPGGGNSWHLIFGGGARESANLYLQAALGMWGSGGAVCSA